jgi:hypothetical protein
MKTSELSNKEKAILNNLAIKATTKRGITNIKKFAYKKGITVHDAMMYRWGD